MGLGIYVERLRFGGAVVSRMGAEKEGRGRGRCIANGFLKRLQHVAPSS